jgi:hypothetical protein
MSQYFGTLHACLDHPTSPVLLTSIGPLGATQFIICFIHRSPGSQTASVEAAGTEVPLSSLRVGPRGRPPRTLTYIALHHKTWNATIVDFSSSYPEGNFKGNQLPGSSMSLSPLYSTPTNDLHVSTATSFHHSFPRLHCGRA